MPWKDSYKQERANEPWILRDLEQMIKEAKEAADKCEGTFADKVTERYRFFAKGIQTLIRHEGLILRFRIARLKRKMAKYPDSPLARKLQRAESFYWDIEAMEEERSKRVLKYCNSVVFRKFDDVQIRWAMAAQQYRNREDDVDSGLGSESHSDSDYSDRSSLGPHTDSESGELNLYAEEDHSEFEFDTDDELPEPSPEKESRINYRW
ncbi:hypothetical protein C8035_v008103 [Colletotrichum spinosum]|uniref:Uncharacterized protein n=1 Tax=Colletotrichum spinosum TaxID=1347390 RepID=A0A4R8QBU0_9PEZI|nr:hypothetical protein C8035_v008103 [Colletotrichum spinosum]